MATAETVGGEAGTGAVPPAGGVAPNPVRWVAEVLRGGAGSRAGRPQLSEHQARRLAGGCWSELLHHDPDVFPVKTERLGVRFYLHEERGGHRLSALVWDGGQWRSLGSLRLPASD